MEVFVALCIHTILNLLAMGLDMYSTESINVKVMSVYVCF